jgi:multidrug efflux system membrane fusion protein
MYGLCRFVFLGCCVTVAGFLAGCTQGTPLVAPPEPPVAPISKPVEREVTDFIDFTGRTDAVEAVDIRARVTGYLTKVLFKEGAEVKADDPLLEIDPRPYQAQLDQAKGQVNLYQAQFKLAQTTYARDRVIAAKSPGGISQEQLDQDVAAVEEADARVKAFKASLEVYQLNLDFTKVKSPINGQVSRYYLTPGNLVNQDQTLLTTIVSLDPVYAYFDLDEATLLRIRMAINAGKIKRYEKGKVPVFMGLQNEEGYPHQGTVNFVNNQVNPTTGSISVRAVFPNPQPKDGARLLSPGMFVRIRLPIGQPHSALLVIDRAVASDQGLKYVYVIDADNKVQYRRVTVGSLQSDGLRVISDGLKSDDWVVVGGLPQLRPRMLVQLEKIAMPSLNPPLVPEADKTAPSAVDNRSEPREQPSGKEKQEPAATEPAQEADKEKKTQTPK